MFRRTEIRVAVLLWIGWMPVASGDCYYRIWFNCTNLFTASECSNTDCDGYNEDGYFEPYCPDGTHEVIVYNRDIGALDSPHYSDIVADYDAFIDAPDVHCNTHECLAADQYKCSTTNTHVPLSGAGVSGYLVSGDECERPY